MRNRIHGRAGRHSNAVEAFRAGLGRDPTHEGLNRNIGVAYANLGRKSKALAHWMIALNVNPNQPNLVKSIQRLRGE